MAYFQWHGLNNKGIDDSGIIFSPNIDSAQVALMYQNIAVMSLRRIRNQSKHSQKVFFHEFITKLALLTTHGIPLHQALGTIFNQITNSYNKANIAAILTNIHRGQSLAEYLKEEFCSSDPYIPALIKSGEESGKIDRSLSLLHEHLEQQAALKRKVAAAITPPIITLFFASTIIIILLIAVVPQFEQLFITLEKPIPTGTARLIGLAKALQNPFFWVLVPIIILIGGILLRILRKNGRLNEIYSQAILTIPWLNHFIIKTEMARFLTMLGVLSDATLPLHRASAIALSSISNLIIIGWFQEVTEKLSLGNPLIQSVKEIPNPAGTVLADLLTPTNSIGVTRKTLSLAITAYEQEALKSINQFTLLIGPILLLFVGGLIFAILIFLYLPLFNLANSI